MKKYIFTLLGVLILNVSLYAKSGESEKVSSEANAAAADIKHINEVVKQSNHAVVKQKTESELEAEEEAKNKEEDLRAMLNLNIYSLKKLKNKIPSVYMITDVKIATMGETFYYVNSEELKRAISHLRKQKELKGEIDVFLSSVKSQKRIKSNYLLNKEFTSIQNKVTQVQKSSQDMNDAYEFKSTGKRVEIKEGLISNRVYAKRVGDFIEISIK